MMVDRQDLDKVCSFYSISPKIRDVGLIATAQGIISKVAA